MRISGNLLKLTKSFLNNRSASKTGVPQGSILGPLFFLVYINDLGEKLSSTVKLFADDTSLFSEVYNTTSSASQLNNDLKIISRWAHKWKMSFNPDPSKRAQEVIFSRKSIKPAHPDVFFNNLPVSRTTYQKHLGLFLDEKLNFNVHVKEKIAKANRSIGLIKKLQNNLPRQALLTIYKSFIRPLLDYGDIIYDQPNNESLCQKLESVQYNASLAITGAIRGTSQQKLYKELGLESLKFRRWYRRLCFLYKLYSSGLPKYLLDLIPKESHSYNTRQRESFGTYYCRTDTFKYSFFPYTITEAMLS